MVDFQSRDRRTRGRDDDGNDDGELSEAEQPDDEDTTQAAAETAAKDSEAGGQAPGAGIAVVTISDERTIDDDPVGDAVVAALDEHEIVTRELLARDHDSVQQAVDALVARSDVDAIVTAGGTGVEAADITIEAVHPLFEKALPGFGELFRTLYYDHVGTDVIATRATAGIANDTPVFCLPGSVTAARVGTAEIVAEQAGHLAEPSD